MNLTKRGIEGTYWKGQGLENKGVRRCWCRCRCRCRWWVVELEMLINWGWWMVKVRMKDCVEVDEEENLKDQGRNW